MIGIDDKANITIVLGDGDVGTGSGVFTDEQVPFLKFTSLDKPLKIGEKSDDNDKDEAAIHIAIKNIESLAVLENQLKFVRTYLEKDYEKLYDMGYKGPMP
jgi:hypothetical protein